MSTKRIKTVLSFLVAIFFISAFFIYKAKIAIDTFYLKICKNCGYTEMYSTKIVQKVEDPVEGY